MSTTRTSRPDMNLLSLSDNEVVWFAGTLNETHGDLPKPLSLQPEAAQSWDSLLKLSNASGWTLHDVAIAQGRENVADFNRGSFNITIQGDFGVGGGTGDQVLTIKGGSHDIALSGAIHSQGRIADCTIGQWSDQSLATSHHLDLTGLYRADSKPVTFVLGRVNNPIRALFGHPKDIQLPAGAKVLFWKSLGTQIYWYGKWAAVKLGLL